MVQAQPKSTDVRTALRDAISRLSAASVPSHTLAAELLLMHVLGRDRAWIYTNPEAALSPKETAMYSALTERRAAGEPTQYLTGKQEFWGLEFEVTPAVLIPRPETEHVVEVALQRMGVQMRSARLRIADVGTGSGCIAIALAKELPNAEIFATDISAPALEVARRNAVRHRVADRIQFVEADLLQPFMHASQVTSYEPPHFDLVVSNPPYVARNDAALLAREIIEHEPPQALFAGPTGLEAYERLIPQAERMLAPSGCVVLEVGFGQSEAVRGLLQSNASWESVETTDDLARVPRVLSARRSDATVGN